MSFRWFICSGFISFILVSNSIYWNYMAFLDFDRGKWHNLSQISSLDGEPGVRTIVLSDGLREWRKPGTAGRGPSKEVNSVGVNSNLIKWGVLEHQMHYRVGLSLWWGSWWGRWPSHPSRFLRRWEWGVGISSLWARRFPLHPETPASNPTLTTTEEGRHQTATSAAPHITTDGWHITWIVLQSLKLASYITRIVLVGEMWN